ncbi:MAG: LPS-assembly protein LptD [Betaproteobacteria bacterium]
MFCALPALALAAEGVRLRPQTWLLPEPQQPEEVPLFIEADRMQGVQDKDFEAFGNARLRKRGQSFASDWMRHDVARDVLDAKGNVRVEQGREIIEGSVLRYEIATDRGIMENPRYQLISTPPRGPAGSGPLPPFDARGTAERLLFQGPGRYRVEIAEYTTCAPGNNAWFVRARQLDLDRERDVGTARDASVVFFDKTLFWSPYLSFSLHEERKSGVLTPSYRSSNTTGFEFTVPYYLNLAPEMDATLYPRFMTKRGLQLGGEFRYMNPTGRGEARAEVLPGDQQISRDRWGLFTKHQQNFGRWSTIANINRVSDGNYFTDLSTLIAVTSQSFLNNDATIATGGNWGARGTYGFSAFAQGWQTLQRDRLAPLTPPYSRLPQFNLTAQRLGEGRGDFDFIGSYTAFDHPSLVNGQRFFVQPGYSMPLQTSYAYVVPKVAAHVTRYAMGKNNAAAVPDTTRALPVFSTEAGLIFERETRISGNSMFQTFEPKAYYVYIPYKDQSRLPNFESGLQDINFATIFSENQFSGQDRVNDANQVTLGAASRFISADSGIERFRAAVAQRFYFDDQRVTLPGGVPRTSNASDFLAALSGGLARNWTLDAGWQFNTDTRQTQRFNVGSRYQPEPGRVFNASYRETRDSVRQVDFSTQWNMKSGWNALGRWNYSLRDGRAIETLAGIEYNDQCWSLRLVAHQFAVTTTSKSTSIFLQLELYGVSRIGTNPLDVLKRNIGGYRQFDPRNPAPVEYNVPGIF